MFLRIVAWPSVALALAGCGTYVPGIEEPFQSSVDGQRFVQAIVQNIDCELRNAIGGVIRQDQDDLRRGISRQRKAAWLDNWGVQMTLNLENNERGNFSPSADWLPVTPASAIFTLGTTGNLSAEANRFNAMGSYHTVYEIVTGPPCSPESRPGGLFLMQSDLKLREWLLDNIMLDGTGVVSQPRAIAAPFKQDVLQHNITFEIVSSGSLAPAWRMPRILVNQSSPLLGASRTRRYVMLLTLGPADPSLLAAQRGRSLPPRVARASAIGASAAANAHLASQIGLSVSSALRNNLR